MEQLIISQLSVSKLLSIMYSQRIKNSLGFTSKMAIFLIGVQFLTTTGHIRRTGPLGNLSASWWASPPRCTHQKIKSMPNYKLYLYK